MEILVKKLLLITFICSILGCNLEPNKKDDGPNPNPNYTGMRSVVDDEFWIEYLTGGIWTGIDIVFGDDIVSKININVLCFTESESLVFSNPLFGNDPKYIIGEFIISDNIFYIKGDDDTNYIKYAEIEINSELEFNKEMTWYLYVDGVKDGSKIDFGFSLTPPTIEPELLSDVVLDDIWLNKLSNTKWISENISYLEIINSTNLIDHYEVNNWFDKYLNENPNAITYQESNDSSEMSLPLIIEMLEYDGQTNTYPIDEYIELIELNITYSEQYQKILDSDYNLEISFNTNSSLINCRIYSEDYEIANYNKKFFIIDSCVYFKGLLGIYPAYSLNYNEDGTLNFSYIDEQLISSAIKKDFVFSRK